MTWGTFDPAIPMPSGTEGDKLPYLGDINSIYNPDRHDALDDMKDEAKEISWATFRKHCSHADAWAKERGYAVAGDGKFGGLRIDRDWAVTFNKSKLNGRVCYYIVWSGFEYVWCEGDPFAEE